MPSLATIITILRMGLPWSRSAALAGFDSGSEFREYCLSMGVSRFMRDGACIIELRPMGAQS